MQNSQRGPCLPSNTTQGKNPPHLACKLQVYVKYMTTPHLSLPSPEGMRSAMAARRQLPVSPEPPSDFATRDGFSSGALQNTGLVLAMPGRVSPARM